MMLGRAIASTRCGPDPPGTPAIGPSLIAASHQVRSEPVRADLTSTVTLFGAAVHGLGGVIRFCRSVRPGAWITRGSWVSELSTRLTVGLEGPWVRWNERAVASAPDREAHDVAAAIVALDEGPDDNWIRAFCGLHVRTVQRGCDLEDLHAHHGKPPTRDRRRRTSTVFCASEDARPRRCESRLVLLNAPSIAAPPLTRAGASSTVEGELDLSPMGVRQRQLGGWGLEGSTGVVNSDTERPRRGRRRCCSR
jgi:hypothetical protein